MSKTTSTLKDIYEITLRLEESFAQINSGLRQLIAKTKSRDIRMSLAELQEILEEEEPVSKDKGKEGSKESIENSEEQTSDDDSGNDSQSVWEASPEVKEKKKKKKRKHVQSVTDKQSQISKPPINPYLFFYHQAKAEILKANPSISMSECGKLILDIWRSFSPQEKEVYRNRQRKERKDSQKRKISGQQEGKAQRII